MTRKIFSPILAAAVVLTMTAPAAAQDASTEPTQRIVRYDDLNLASANGRARLETRLRMAANAACGMSSAREMIERTHARQCRDAALEQVRPRMEQALREAGQQLAGRSE